MNKLKAIKEVREKLSRGDASIGSWMQIPHPSIAEIMGQSGYDWVAVDMEHGSVSVHQLPDLFRALELGSTLPLVRLAQGHTKDCKQALDAGACGVIVPMVETAQQLLDVKNACCWPPVGTRGVGFSRANLFGKNFDSYQKEAQAPLLVAMIEHFKAVDNLEEILKVDGLDAIFVGPYDLSASLGLTGQFEHPDFQELLKKIHDLANLNNIPMGIHIVSPSKKEIQDKIADSYQFLAYSIDSVMLRFAADYGGN